MRTTMLRLGLIGTLVTVATSAPAYGQLQKLFSSKKPDAPAPAAAAAAAKWSEVVCEVNGEPITREQLADELIATFGAKQLELIVNRKVIEQACKQQKVEISRPELEAELDATLKRLNLSRKEFVERILASRELSLIQYVRDTIWPKIALKKLVADKVAVTEDDLKKAFEANYGEKARVRMLVVKERRKAEEIWAKLDQEKDKDKRYKLFGSLAKTFSVDESTRAYEGDCQPINHYSSLGEIEKMAFDLQEGELSRIQQVQEGHLIFLGLGRVPPVQGASLDSVADEKTKDTVRTVLQKDIAEKKMRVEVAKLFQSIRKNAKIISNPEFKDDPTDDGVMRTSHIETEPAAAPGRSNNR